MRAKIKASFECSKCGAAYAKWAGQCTSCGEWNSVVEISKAGRAGESLKRLSDVLDIDELQRIPTEIAYLDRILGGGLPRGTAVLLAGEPGIGKSTLLFHMLLRQKATAVYVSAEESVEQVAQRFKVLEKPKSAELFLVSENRVEKILELMDQHKPQVMVLDSIQMTLSETMERSRGGAAAIRDISEALVSKAKQLGITFWLVGHVTKDGEIAGPKMLEHLVDTVVTFSMAEDHRLRILQAQKNRYGRSGEVVLLEMSDKGLQESEAWNSFWVEREGQSISGCALTTTLLGSRIACVEIQALVVDSYFPSPKRSATGFDHNRLHLILAVLEKRLKIPFSKQDVYLNVVGGLRISDPGVDLAVAAALVSAHSETPVPKGSVFSGELGLTGELRLMSVLDDRLRFAEQMQLKIFVGPKAPSAKHSSKISYKPCSTVAEALSMLF